MTACSGPEQKLVEGGASSGGVAGSSIEKEVNPVEEDIDKCVATLLKDGEAYQQYLKQFETEKLVEKLLKVGDTCNNECLQCVNVCSALCCRNGAQTIQRLTKLLVSWWSLLSERTGVKTRITCCCIYFVA